MKRLGNFKIGTRLGFGFGIVIVFTLLTSGIGIQYLKDLSALTAKLHRHPYAVSTAMLRIEANIVKMHRSMKDVALAKTPAQMEAAAGTVAGYEKAVYQDFETVNERFLGDKKKVQQARKLFSDWKGIRDEVIRLMAAGQREAAAEITKGKGAQHVQTLYQTVDAFVEFADGKAGEFLQKAEAARDRALLISYLILGLSIIAGVIAAFLITRSITGPLKKAVSTAERIAGGDLTMKISSVKTDETGQLLSSMGKMIADLSEMLTGNIETSHALSEGASEQAASLEETSSSLEEMASMTQTNAQNAGQADHIVKEAQGDMDQAGVAMTELTGSMQEISRASEETSKIIKTIDEIAFQTNLLALNAAVEAARAGEAGAGFAVVADEVRNLAMRAAEAAKNTAGLIEGTVKKIHGGAQLVEKTNAAFVKVAAGSVKAGELIGEIAAASNEQAQGIEQLSTAANEMDRVTQQNAASAEELASRMAMFRVDGSSSRKRAQTGKVKEALLPASHQTKAHPQAARQGAGLDPEAVIPMDDGDFTNF